MDKLNSPDVEIDVAELATRFFNDDSLLQELVDMLLESWPETAEAIRTAIANNDVEAAREEAHGIKGAIGNFGGAAAYNSALALETMAATNNLAGIEELLETMGEQVSQLCTALRDVSLSDFENE